MASIRALARTIARAEHAIQQAAWPEGVMSRYLTVGGATVDIRPSSHEDRVSSVCTGCGEEDCFSHEKYIRERAQRHAETCRALPKPTA